MSDPQKNDASAGSEPFVPCYNKKNWEEDSWCQEDCIQRILDNPETCDWHCVDPDMARQTTTNTGWACTSGGKYSRCTNSCGCRGSPGDSTWCCGAESTDVCWDNKCYASCAITLPPSEPSSRPTLKTYYKTTHKISQQNILRHIQRTSPVVLLPLILHCQHFIPRTRILIITFYCVGIALVLATRRIWDSLH